MLVKTNWREIWIRNKVWINAYNLARKFKFVKWREITKCFLHLSNYIWKGAKIQVPISKMTENLKMVIKLSNYKILARKLKLYYKFVSSTKKDKALEFQWLRTNLWKQSIDRQKLFDLALRLSIKASALFITLLKIHFEAQCIDSFLWFCPILG